jgi:hypothetical protein
MALDVIVEEILFDNSIAAPSAKEATNEHEFSPDSDGSSPAVAGEDPSGSS